MDKEVKISIECLVKLNDYLIKITPGSDRYWFEFSRDNKKDEKHIVNDMIEWGEIAFPRKPDDYRIKNEDIGLDFNIPGQSYIDVKDTPGWFYECYQALYKELEHLREEYQCSLLHC